MALNETNVRRLAESLRSGRYAQDFNRLGGKYKTWDEKYERCPVGVACELYIHDHPDLAEWGSMGDCLRFIHYTSPESGDYTHFSTTSPSNEVAEIFSDDLAEGMLFLTDLMRMNDEERRDFGWIADNIERRLARSIKREQEDRDV
jgi:hypothetical protein